jgi:hypothetical protein
MSEIRPAATPAATEGTDTAVRIDPRGPRFAAGITSVVLAVIVLTGSAWLLAAQVLVFAVGALFGVGRSPYAWVYRRVVRPRLGPPDELEDPAPPRFAQTVGLVVTGVALALGLLGIGPAVVVGAALAFVAAFLNASINFCLGCRLYLLLARVRNRTA